MTLTVEDLRGHIETGLGDDALQTLLDAAYEAIDQYAGPVGSRTEILSGGPGDLLMVSASVDSVTTLIEDSLVLASDDYQVNGQMLIRLDTGTNPRYRWGSRVEVTYVALSDDALRDRVAVALIQADLDFHPGLTAETVGAWSQQYAQSSEEYRVARAAILESLNDPTPFIY